MPYMRSRNTVQSFTPMRRRRRRGFSGLGDCQPYAQWTAAIKSNISPLPMDANCPIGQNGALSPCGIEAQQLSTAIQDIQSQLGDCVPSGTSISVTLDGTGNPTDTPAYSISVPGGPSWNSPMTTDINYVPPPLTGAASGVMASAAAPLIAAGIPVTSEAAAAAANPVAAVYQAPSTSSGRGIPRAVATPGRTTAQALTRNTTGATPSGGTSSSSSTNTGSSSTAGGISIWVWIIGGAALVLLLTSGGKK